MVDLAPFLLWSVLHLSLFCVIGDCRHVLLFKDIPQMVLL